MPKCTACFLKLKVDGVNTKFCGDDIPTVFHVSATTFEIEGKTSEDCSLSIIWRQVTADDLCCKEIEIVKDRYTTGY